LNNKQNNIQETLFIVTKFLKHVTPTDGRGNNLFEISD